MQSNTTINPKIDVDSVLPEGVQITTIAKEAIGIIGLSSDNGVWLWYNGEWKRFIINYDIMSEETEVEETAPEGTESTETSEVAAEAQAETPAEEAVESTEAATEAAQ